MVRDPVAIAVQPSPFESLRPPPLRSVREHQARMGTPSELLDALTALVRGKAAGEMCRPRSACGIARSLRLTAPQLGTIGMTVDFDRSRDARVSTSLTHNIGKIASIASIATRNLQKVHPDDKVRRYRRYFSHLEGD